MAGPALIPANAVWEWYDRFGGPSWFIDAVYEIDSVYLEVIYSGRKN